MLNAGSGAGQEHGNEPREKPLYGANCAAKRRSVKSIAEDLGVSASTVSRWLEYLPQTPPKELPEVLSIDEFRGNSGSPAII